MGNCLVLHHKAGVINLMMEDGKILHFPSPLKVHQALLKFPGHAIADSIPVAGHLHPDTDMLCGNLYYLLAPAPEVTAVAEAKPRPDVLRIKLVVSKQELKELVSGGAVSLDDVLSRLVQGQRNKGDGGGDGNKDAYRNWKPTLESIPEGIGL